MPKVTFIRNAKVNKSRYKINDSLEVNKKEYDVLLEAGVIKLIDEELFEDDGGGSEEDLSLLSREELKKITNDNLKSFLNKKETAYSSGATKDELIDAILGKEPTS